MTPIAGAFSDFSLQLDRDDGDQFLGDLNFKMPLGFTGSLRGISYCPEAAIAARRRQYRARRAGAAELSGVESDRDLERGGGAGTHPFHVDGRIYMAGPLKGAPLSLAVITPALAGPYDYGTQVVRVALHIDPITAQVKAVSDTVPQIIGGVPLRLRSIRVTIDRPNFAINPTNCAPLLGRLAGNRRPGYRHRLFLVLPRRELSSLPFKPKMTFRALGGHKKAHRSANPPMRIDLRTQPGNANIKSLSVTLPKAFAIDQRHLGNICSKAQLEAESCAGRQPIGTAMTRTPLLDAPLQGPAYAVSGFGNLPRLAFILDGQVRLVPQAESRSVGGRLQTTVPTVPDAPIGHFRLDLLGGKKGYLVNTRSLCKGAAMIAVEYTGQNGKARSESDRVMNFPLQCTAADLYAAPRSRSPQPRAETVEHADDRRQMSVCCVDV